MRQPIAVLTRQRGQWTIHASGRFTWEQMREALAVLRETGKAGA